MTDRCEIVRDLAAGFVLGALTPDEDRLVRDHLATCDRPHSEFAELGGVVPYLAESVPQVEPPPTLKARVMAAAAAERRAGASRAIPAPPAIATPSADERAKAPAVVERLRRGRPAAALPQGRLWGRRSPLAWAAGLAAVLAIAVLGVWNVTLQRDLEAARGYERGLSAVLDVGAAPGSRTAILTADGDGPSGLAAVAPDGRVALVMRGLAPTTGSEVYEAWVIVGEEAPEPIGSFTVAADGTGTLATTAGVGDSVTIALTREPTADATTPTLPIISSGALAAPGS